MRRTELEGGGGWELVSEQGEVFELADFDESSVSDGDLVEIEGVMEAEMFSVSMVGPILRVLSVRKVPSGGGGI